MSKHKHKWHFVKMYEMFGQPRHHPILGIVRGEYKGQEALFICECGELKRIKVKKEKLST